MRATQTAALELTRHGYRVIQMNGKRPVDTGWNKAQRATPAEIAGWTGQNIGILTGSDETGNRFALDCDGLTGYAAFRAALPDLVDTWTVATGSGNGMHVHFTTDILPDNVQAMKIAALDNNNLEIKAEGKVVVAPPSIHPDTGKPYTVSIAAPVKHLTGDDTQRIINFITSHQSETERRKATRQPITFTGNSQVSSDEIQAIVTVLPPHREPNGAGWINFCCPLPGHDDREPSAGFNVQTGVFNCYRCGSLSIEKFAEALGVDLRRRARLGYTRVLSNDRVPVSPTPAATSQTEPAPEAAPEHWLTDGLRKAVLQLRSKKGFEGLPDNALPFLEIINIVPETFTTTDSFTVSFRSKTGMNEDSVRKLLAVLIDQETGLGLFFDDLKTLVNEPVSTSRQKRGRSTKTYRRLSRPEVEKRLIQFAEKAYRESLATPYAPIRVTSQILQDIGVCPQEASQLPDELNALAASDAMIEHQLTQAIATLKMHFRDTHLTVLPDDLPRHNGKTWVVAWTRAKTNEHHRQPMTRAAIVQEIGISNASIESVFDRANIKRIRQIGTHAPQYLRRDENISTQIQRAKKRVGGKPVKLLARKGETERVLYLRENTDPAPFAKQALSEGYEVMVHCETAAVIEMTEYTERKKQAPEKRRILIAPAPRQEAKPSEVMQPISLKHSREWVRKQLLLRLIISQGGEVPPPEVGRMPVDELLEYIVGRPLQWVEPEEQEVSICVERKPA